jgi:hypothetical protein
MYFYSDLKNLNEGAQRRKRSNHHSIDMLNNRNIDANIDALKESISQKNKFLSSYKQVTGMYLLNKSNNNSSFAKSKMDDSFIKHAHKELRSISSNRDLRDQSTSIYPKSQEEEISIINQADKNNGTLMKNSDIISEKNSPNLSALPLIPNRNFSQNHSYMKDRVSNISFIAPTHVRNRSYNSFMLEVPEDKYVAKEFSKIFDKNLNYILKIKSNKKYDKTNLQKSLFDERQKFGNESRTNQQIVDIKDKLHFMKGVIDYCFPKIMIDKIKLIHETQKEQRRASLSRQESLKFNDREEKFFENFEEKTRKKKDNSASRIKLPFQSNHKKSESDIGLSPIRLNRNSSLLSNVSSNNNIFLSRNSSKNDIFKLCHEIKNINNRENFSRVKVVSPIDIRSIEIDN